MSLKDDSPASASPAAEILRLETRVLEAERRFVPAVLHFLDTRRKLPPDDPRRRAARTALLWCFFPFNNAASAAGFLGIFLTVATVYLAYQANTMVQQELAAIKEQNEITRSQFSAQREADARRRQIELLTTLYAHKDCPASELIECPFVAQAQARVYALAELSSLQAILPGPGGSTHTAVLNVDLSDIVFPGGIQLQGLDLGGIDLSYSSINDATLTNLQFYPYSPKPRLRGTTFRSVNLIDLGLDFADLRNAQMFGKTKLTRVSLAMAKLDGMKLGHEPRLEFDHVDFHGASLKGVNFAGVDLKDCTFVGAKLDGAFFSLEQQTADLVAALGRAETCPNGERAEGSCTRKMVSVPWINEDQEQLARFLNRVEVGLMNDPARVTASDERFMVTLDIAAPTGSERLDLHIEQSTLDPAQLIALRDLLYQHAAEIHFDWSYGFRERVTIFAADGLITSVSAFGTSSFRNQGCIESSISRYQDFVLCKRDSTHCQVKWPFAEGSINFIPCKWDRAHADELLEYRTQGERHSISIIALGEHTLLRHLGFRPGDIVESADPGEWPTIRHAQLWARADTQPASEHVVYKLIVTRDGHRSNRSIVVWGRRDDTFICGNGRITHNEECDGVNLGGASCETLGWARGLLLCHPRFCTYDVSMCR